MRSPIIGTILFGIFFGLRVDANDPPSIVEWHEAVFGDIIRYQDLDTADAARKKAVQSLRARCQEWEQEVAKDAAGKTLLLETRCSDPKIRVEVERIGSGSGKGMQAWTEAIVRIGPSEGYRVFSDAIRAAYINDQPGGLLLAAGSYRKRCADWKASLRAQFGDILVHASCGPRRSLYREDQLGPGGPPGYGTRGIAIGDGFVPPPFNVPGYRYSSQGEFLLLLEDQLDAFPQTVGRLDKSAFRGGWYPEEIGTMIFDFLYHHSLETTPASARAIEESYYWQSCAFFKSGMQARFGARFVFASCEPSLSGELVKGFGSDLRADSGGYYWAGFSAKTAGLVWYFR